MYALSLPDEEAAWGLLEFVADLKPGEEGAFADGVNGLNGEDLPPSAKIDVKTYVYPGQDCQQPFEVAGEPQVDVGTGVVQGKLKNGGQDAAVADVDVLFLDGAGQIVGEATGAPMTQPIPPGQVGDFTALPPLSGVPTHARTIVNVVPSAGLAVIRGLYFPGLHGGGG